MSQFPSSADVSLYNSPAGFKVVGIDLTDLSQKPNNILDKAGRIIYIQDMWYYYFLPSLRECVQDENNYSGQTRQIKLERSQPGRL
jgi:hypothetical protein